MVNIALLNDSFTPQYDGVAICTENYARIINQDYGKSFVIVPEEKKRDVSKFPYQVIEYPALHHAVADQYKVGVPISPKFRKQISDLTLDLVHSQTPFVSGLLAQSIAHKKGAPHISTFHSKYKDDINQRLAFSTELSDEIVTEYISRFYHHCDYVWTVSNGTADTLREYGFKGKIKVMPNGSDMPVKYRDPETRQRIALEYGLNAEKPIFLFVGRLTKLKNIHLIAMALGALKRSDREFSMLFVGGGEDEDKLRALIQEHDLEHCVKLAGKVMDREKLRDIYSSCDLFVFPSVYDNAPLVVREAAACGCAALMVKGSNASEGVISGQNGILVEARIEDITLGISDALNHYDLAKLGSNARRDIYISWDDVMKMVIDEYRRILTDWKPKERSKLKTVLSDIDLFGEIRSSIPKS